MFKFIPVLLLCLMGLLSNVMVAEAFYLPAYASPIQMITEIDLVKKHVYLSNGTVWQTLPKFYAHYHDHGASDRELETWHIGDKILLDSVCLTNLTIDRYEHVYLYTKPIDGFLHIAAMDDGGKIITLSDGSIWSIGWLRALLISSDWQIGQSILITKYSNDPTAYGLANVTIRQGEVYATLISN